MKIFLDFDDAMFNTKDFKEGLINVFCKNGVSKEDFLKTYKDYPTLSGKVLQKYDPYKQIKLLEKNLGINGKKIKSDMDNFLASCEKYLFSDVKFFLKNIDKKNLYLISYGHTGFQDKKIDNCDIKKYFKKVVVTDKLKSEVADRFAALKERFVFVDDRIIQINAMKKKFPNSLNFLIKRKEGRYSDKRTKYVDFEVKNFREILKIIKKIQKC